MIDFENLNEIKFNIKAMYHDEARNSLTETFQLFCEKHGGEMWTSILLCMLFSEMEHVARKYGYKLVSTRDENILYVQVVEA